MRSTRVGSVSAPLWSLCRVMNLGPRTLLPMRPPASWRLVIAVTNWGGLLPDGQLRFMNSWAFLGRLRTV